MDADAKKTALRMIPYGLYLLTSRDSDGSVDAATVNWVTQTAFEPPLVAVGVKVDSTAHGFIQRGGAFALNVLGRDQGDLAYQFFKTAESDDAQIGGLPYRAGVTGAPILEAGIAYLDCRVVELRELGDHSTVIGEVLDAGVTRAPDGRADEATLHLGDLGERVFYGG